MDEKIKNWTKMDIQKVKQKIKKFIRILVIQLIINICILTLELAVIFTTNSRIIKMVFVTIAVMLAIGLADIIYTMFDVLDDLKLIKIKEREV